MLGVDPERLFLPRSPERGLRAVEGSTVGYLPRDFYPRCLGLCHNPRNLSFRTSRLPVGEIRNPEEHVWFPASAGTSLDPGSRPASRDLAGMTDCDTASQQMGCFVGGDSYQREDLRYFSALA
jgi:hypothetical protein